jgi:hypothetical protein
MYYGHTMVLQTDFGEGMRIEHPTVVGSDWLFTQDYSQFDLSILGSWPVRLNEIFVQNGEVNTAVGGLNMTLVIDGFVADTHFSVYGSPATWTCFNYVDVANTQHSDIMVDGNATLSGGCVGVSHSLGTRDASNCTWADCNFSGCTTAVVLNSGVYQNVVQLAQNLVPAGGGGNVLGNNFIDNSGNSSNVMTWLNALGGVSCTEAWIFGMKDGTTGLKLDQVASAANFIEVTPATAGNPPTISFTGSGSATAGTVQTKGGQLAFTAQGDGASGPMLTLINEAASVGYLTVQNASHGNGVVISTLSTDGSNPNLIIQAKTGGYVQISDLPTSSAGLPSGTLWNNSGVLHIA